MTPYLKQKGGKLLACFSHGNLFMNKKTPVFMLLATAILFSECIAHKKTRYVFPEYISKERQPDLIKMCETGRLLYAQYCSDCHGIFSKGKDGIPNFTDEQVDNYTAFAVMKDKKNHGTAGQMSAEQLTKVTMFLKYRERKGAPAVMNQQAVSDTLRK